MPVRFSYKFGKKGGNNMLRYVFNPSVSLFKIIRVTVYIALVGFALLVGCTNLEKLSNKSLVPETRGSHGFLAMDALPDSIALLPPPPAEGSIAYELDKEINRISLSLRGSQRWQLAAEHLNALIPEEINAFYCSLNAQITEQETPYLYALLYRSIDDIRFTDTAAKYKYNRPLPFIVNNEPICIRQKTHNYASYPSGRAARAWAFALILSEIAPERSDDILARGRAIGQNSVVCNLAWQSDVNEGRLLGSIVVARLHALPEFQAAIEAAKSELASVWAKDLPPIRDCETENTVLFQSSLATF
jgi:acid phosphatase (class A)